MDAKEEGAVPVVIRHTPRNKFDNGLIESNSASFGAWTAEVAGQQNVPFIDLNGLIGRKLQHMADHEGLLTVNRCYKNDHSHFSLEGARLNAREVAETVNRLLEAK